MDRIRNQDPLTRPLKSKRSPKPLCHAASAEMRDRVRLAYRSFGQLNRVCERVVSGLCPGWMETY